MSCFTATFWTLESKQAKVCRVRLLTLIFLFCTACTTLVKPRTSPSISTSPEYLESEATKSIQPADPSLVVEDLSERRLFRRSDLLRHPHLEEVQVDHDPAYGGQPRTYLALALWSLFKNASIEASSTVLFTCEDGFSAPIGASRLLNQNSKQAVAYLAIENPKNPWPILKANSFKTAGPFYIIWKNPQRSGIKPEEWPFQVTQLILKPPIKEQYPNLFPAPSVAKTSSVQKGFGLFLQNCFSCHRLNGEGTSELGPDLNIPFNPTEYMTTQSLVTLIRNPQELRRWPQSKMSVFPKSVLSDQEIENILSYLRHMRTRKITLYQ